MSILVAIRESRAKIATTTTVITLVLWQQGAAKVLERGSRKAQRQSLIIVIRLTKESFGWLLWPLSQLACDTDRVFPLC